uniref:Sushi, von Willebrand factor type A, EGF and pentraxin domain-containing protein 1 n=1 Tax=Branchiostoma floridae TaxID=7739 RepID=C3YF05_BRAFL|eukprot:XP_002605239.1 hypothetical protein BRAFLDRAFT_92287 [Branchiostoma floridae]
MDDNHPAADDNHPATGDNHTATGDNHTATGDNHPTTGDNHTAMDDNHPATGDNHTALGDNIIAVLKADTSNKRYAMTGSNSYKDVATFTCDPGYKLVGTSTRTCQSYGTWSGGSPACKIEQCPTLKPPANVIMEGTKSYRGVTYFSCTRGHTVVGAKSIRCRADGTWSNRVPTCRAVQCTRLTPPRNGAVSGSNSYGDVATFTCNPGYKLVGTSTRTCQSDGTWSGGSSTCRAVRCPTLRGPTNGNMRGSKSYRGSLRFTCDRVYSLVGAKAIRCQADGTWSDRVPTCKAIRCPTLTPPENGAVKSSNSYRDVTFKCDPGYKLVGTSTRTCQSGGTWSGGSPTCRAPKKWREDWRCGQAFPAEDGNPAECNLGGLKPCCSNAYWCGNTASHCDCKTCVDYRKTAECRNGYQLLAQTCFRVSRDKKNNDDAQAACEKEGATLAMPKTRELDVSLRNWVSKFGKSAFFWIGLKQVPVKIWQWEDGSHIGKHDYKAANHNVVTATMSRVTTTLPQVTTTLSQVTTTLSQVAIKPLQLTTTPPQLTTKPPQMKTTQPQVTTKPLEVTTKPLQVTTIPPQVTTTLPNMTTSLQQVTTTPPRVTTASQCSKLPPPGNGAVTGSNSYGDVATFTCNPGYKLFGTSTRTCQADGTWSGKPPTCKIVQCTSLKPPTNGIMRGANSYQGVTYFTCARGYTLVGVKSIRCQADGTWSDRVPTCQVIQCPQLAPPVNGEMSGSNSHQGLMYFTCDRGYYLVGAKSIRCQADGTWSGHVPTCQPVQCTRLTPPTNGAMYGSNSYGHQATFTCNPGYKLVGTSSRTCQSDGTWSGGSPTCTAVRCPTPRGLTNGNMRGSTSYRGSMRFTCNRGYNLVGVKSIRCQADGTWGDRVPTCQAVQCPTPERPANGDKRGSTSYPGSTRFTCDRGYKLVGKETVKCQADGKWSARVPTCQATRCPKLTPPANGAMTGSTSYGDVVIFACNPGYKLVGTSTRTCQSDGTWSGGSPTCRAAQCTMLPPPSNGAVTGSNSYGDVATFICNPGYKLVGTSARTCQSDGTWSGKSPTCTAECRNGYQLIAQTCIRVSRDEKNYDDALAACENEDATLAMPKTKELDVSLRNWVSKFGRSQDFWIGLKERRGSRDSWEWSDGSRLDDHDYKVRYYHLCAVD